MSEKIIVAVALSGLSCFLLLWGFGADPWLRALPLWVVVLVGGFPQVLELAKQARRGNFSSDWLAGLSIVTACFLNEPLAASIVVLMLSGGGALERFATKQASSSLHALAERMPNQAFKKGAAGLEPVPVDTLQPGDIIVVVPQGICPADGVVVEGHGAMDEAFITGEPYTIAKAPGSTVVSGAVNGEVALTIEVTKRPSDSRYAKIAEVMQQTAQSRMQLRRLGDLLGAWYTPLAVTIAVIAWLASGDATRLLAVLVIATPCPLLISIPVAIIGAVSLAAKRGLIVRDPTILERLPTCTTIILDKTGTLTRGRPVLSGMKCIGRNDEDELLALAASIEQYSKHPLARAVLQAAQERKLTLQEVTLVSRKAGIGLTGSVRGHTLVITSRAKAAAEKFLNVEALPPFPGGLECVLVVDRVVAAVLWFRDEPRQHAEAFVKHLSVLHLFKKVMVVSGDREDEVRHVAKQLGISEAHGGKSPEDKIRIVREETTKAPTFFLGDGINDAPAMLAATVGAAFGYQSDITAEAAGVVIMDPDLEKVDELMHISKHMRGIALQSAVGGMALSLCGMGFAAFGYLTPVSGALAQELIDIAAVLNALRALQPPRKLTDFV